MPLLPVTPIRRRKRRQDRASLASAPPPLGVAYVAVDHGHDFDWSIYWEFDGPLPPVLNLADFLGLTVDSTPPAAVEDRGGNWVILLFHSDGGVNAPWLVTPAAAPLFLPGQSGTVGEL